jgi:hypothetical protein
MTSRLKLIKRQRLHEPLCALIYGDEGLGKTTLGAHAPNPIFLDIEGGSGHIEVARYPFHDGDAGHVPRTYEEVCDAVLALTNEPHDYKTIVIDTIDALEPLMWSYVCNRHSGIKSPMNPNGSKLTSIESFGYGKGFVVALDEWRRLCKLLEVLRAKRGMAVILLGHSLVKSYHNPLGEDFDRITIRLQDSPKTSAAAFVKQWCGVVAYLAFEQFAGVLMSEADRSNARPKGTSTGRHILHVRRTAAFDAKSRIPLPPEVELEVENPWRPFAAAIAEGRSMAPEKIIELIDIELDRIGDPGLTAIVVKQIATYKDNTTTLSRILDRARGKTSKEND